MGQLMASRILKSSITSKTTFQGREGSFIFQVDGLTPGIDIAALAEAAAVTAGYGVGDALSGLGRIEELSAAVINEAGDAVNVNIIWRQRFPSTQVEVFSFVQEEEVCKDKDGDLMEVIYTKARKKSWQKQKVTERKKVAYRGIRVTQQETSDPTGKVDLVGTVNSGGWTYDSGAATGTWFFHNLNTSIITASAWTCTYEFIKKSGGFAVTGFWLDPELGRLPEDAGEAGETDAVKQFYLYEEASWSGLL